MLTNKLLRKLTGQPARHTKPHPTHHQEDRPETTREGPHQDHQEQEDLYGLTREDHISTVQTATSERQRSRSPLWQRRRWTEAVEVVAKAAVAAPTTLRQQTDRKLQKLDKSAIHGLEERQWDTFGDPHWARTRTRSTRRT
jgi:hypothetical protein